MVQIHSSSNDMNWYAVKETEPLSLQISQYKSIQGRKFHNMQKQLKIAKKYNMQIYFDKATNQSTSTATEIERDRDMRWGSGGGDS